MRKRCGWIGAGATGMVVALIVSGCMTAPLAPEADGPADIPQIEAIRIDGKLSDWGERGYRVDMLQYGVVPESAADFYSRCRFAWDEHGLLVRLDIHDNTLIEDDEGDFWKMDGVELLAGSPEEGGVWFQVFAAPGADGSKAGTLRKVINKGAKPPCELAIESASAKTDEGYVVELRLPWRNLPVGPGPGGQIGIMLVVHDVDEVGGATKTQLWMRGRGAWTPSRFQRLRLAQQAAPVIRVCARGEYRHLVAGVVDVTAVASLAGRSVEVWDGKTRLARGSLAADRVWAVVKMDIPVLAPGRSHGALVVRVDGERSTSLVMPDIERQRHQELQRAKLKVSSVFSGDKLPRIEFENPGWVETVAGRCRVVTRYYGADYIEVNTATNTGRYGAVMTISPEHGDQVRRYITLFRQPRELLRRKWEWETFRGSLPAELGIDETVVATQRRTLADFAKWRFAEAMDGDKGAAALLAGFAETGASEPAYVERTSVWARDRRWWYGLKKSLGLVETRHLLYLPPDYARDKSTKWPLMLFLHGAGERGDDLEKVRQNGPPKLIKEGGGHMSL